MTLTEFLLARIAEDEDVARRAAFGYGTDWSTEDFPLEDWSTVHADGKRDMVGCEDEDVTHNIARHDPARVLRECEAKRRIVRRCEHLSESIDVNISIDARATLRDLAAIYADHPDFDPAWSLGRGSAGEGE